MYRIAIVVAAICGLAASQCHWSETTASGTLAPATICSGDLIFEDDFDTLDLQKWQHEKTLAGGGNYEFQWYTNNRTNSFVRNGILYVKPSLTADDLGYEALYRNNLDLHGGTPADECTNPSNYGCVRTGSADNVLNPVKSAILRTVHSFSFKYGTVQIRAKMPTGDWIWPAIWMMPRYNSYGGWPTSGEIDIVESRGNRDYSMNGYQMGTQLVGSTLHWGYDWLHNGFEGVTHWEKSNSAGFNNEFHLYEVRWSTTNINFFVDNEYIGGIAPPAGGFWDLGWWGNRFPNPWQGAGVMAPFDQEFYIIINNAVGGVTGFFPTGAVNANGLPWDNYSPRAMTDFWENRDMWLHTWNLYGSDDTALQVDYIRVYAL